MRHVISWTRELAGPGPSNPGVRVQPGSKTRPFHGSFEGLIAIRATESMGLGVRSSTHNPKVVSSNLTSATKISFSFNRFREPRYHPN